MNILTLDIETNLAHDRIWLCCAKWADEIKSHYFLGDYDSICKLTGMIKRADLVVGHNIIGFDAPVLRKVWGVTIPISKARDTLVMSRLYHPNLEGGHSLKAWGKRLGYEKMDFDIEDFDAGYTEEMAKYCERDVNVTEVLHDHLLDLLEEQDQAMELETQVAIRTKQQESNGFKLDVRLASELLATMNSRMLDITIELQEIFPPLVHERWSEKTGKRLKDRVEEFNVGSRQQIASRLQSIGVKFKTKTEKGNIIVDEGVLKSIAKPEAKIIAEYLMLQKRVGMIDSWLEAADSTDRVHGRVISNGAITGRMTHSKPNMGQITSVKSEYGKESRQCWIVEEGCKLVGADLSGIELRCLAHYMQDADYTKELLDGDIHTANQHAAGLSTRDQAKTFIYALLYGAGAEKIGSIVGGSSRQGKKLIDTFMGNMPALEKLMSKVKGMASQGYVRGLDGRKIWIRHEHAALNSLLQSAGAIIAKQWCVEVHRLLREHSIPAKQVAIVHDEIQMEVKEEHAEKCAELMILAAENCQALLNFRVPITAEAKIGNNWYETH